MFLGSFEGRSDVVMIASHKRLACWLTSSIPWWGTNLERLAPGSQGPSGGGSTGTKLKTPWVGGGMFVDLIVSSCSSDLPFVVWCLMIEHVMIYLDLRNSTSSLSQFWFGDLCHTYLVNLTWRGLIAMSARNLPIYSPRFLAFLCFRDFNLGCTRVENGDTSRISHVT